MNIKEIARASDVVDHNRFFAEYVPIQPAADAAHLSPARTVTALIFAICGWSLIEAPFECGASSDDAWLLAVVVAKLTIIAAGVGAIEDVRFARGIFAFICGTSVLAIAPGLPFDFKHSIAISLLSLIECAGKSAFVILFCTGPMRERKLSVSCRPRCAALAGASKQPCDSRG
ncbi:hypothetical protein LMG28727_07234 [Paraburkholderia kirstenboschensis]|uniref:hypothetical protein n=1 Tax=Paraburkholderia kirstenboschensis TaxID=1245436 RepID=UPI000B1B768A|nr:hypothetical protein [Paraburkholderia kirstenboschensis]CAD6560826.1 hypothetical protein LMG28727_07234 [Paraburkholderia kirstenboschensis]